MSEPRPALAWRDLGSWATVWFGGAFLLFAIIGVIWTIDLQAPRITLLGSGEGDLAVFVSAGGSRVLIASGDDPASLLTALERARHPISRRLDVVLVGATANDLRGALPLFTEPGDAQLYLLGPRPETPFSEALPAGIESLSGPIAIQLEGGVLVTIVPVIGAAGDDNASGWYALTTLGANEPAVLIASSAAVAASLALPTPPDALVIASGGDPLAAWAAVPARLLAFPDGAISGPELRQTVRDDGGPAWAIRVFPGEAIRLELGAGGVEFAAGAAQALASPVSGAPPPAGP